MGNGQRQDSTDLSQVPLGLLPEDGRLSISVLRSLLSEYWKMLSPEDKQSIIDAMDAGERSRVQASKWTI